MSVNNSINKIKKVSLKLINLVEHDISMEGIKNWAVQELSKLMQGSAILELEDIKQLVAQLMNENSSAINETFSSLMDFSRKDVKAFI